MSNTVTRDPNDASRPASALNILAGIWLIISAWVLGFVALRVALWDAVIIGIAVIVLAAIRMSTTGTTGLSWINFLLGIWLIISPFALGFSAASVATGNVIILGILVGIFGLWAALANQSTTMPTAR